MPSHKDTLVVISRKVEIIYVSNEGFSTTGMATSGLPAKLAALQLLLANDRAQNLEAAAKLYANHALGPPTRMVPPTSLPPRTFNLATPPLTPSYVQSPASVGPSDTQTDIANESYVFAAPLPCPWPTTRRQTSGSRASRPTAR